MVNGQAISDVWAAPQYTGNSYFLLSFCIAILMKIHDTYGGIISVRAVHRHINLVDQSQEGRRQGGLQVSELYSLK